MACEALSEAKAAAAAAADALAAAQHAGREVAQLRGRMGQADSRLDTLWQARAVEAAGSSRETSCA
jgi:hypothetical protein